MDSLGSSDYSDAAAHRNSENVLVNWGNAQLAAVYLEHFERNYAQATAYQPGYCVSFTTAAGGCRVADGAH